MAGSLVTVATACLWRVAFRRHEDPPTVRDFNSDSGYGLFMACDSGYGLFMACDSGYGLFMACGVTVATACLWRVAFRRHEDPPTVRDFNSAQASVKASCGVGRRQQARSLFFNKVFD
ncbi:hypothetical protein INR49_020973 [Caranx melampygus]|nr:hypothetical protein INR49_020973 [Caranx melampygus]